MKTNNSGIFSIYDLSGNWNYDIGNFEYEKPMDYYEGKYSGVDEGVTKIPNGGFETGDTTDWSFIASGGSYSVTNEDKHSGVYSLRLNATINTGHVRARYRINLTEKYAGEILNFSFWYKLRDFDTVSGNFKVDITPYDKDGNTLSEGAYIIIDFPDRINTSWIYNSTFIPISPSLTLKTDYIIIQFWDRFPNQTGWIYFDDINLTFIKFNNDTVNNQIISKSQIGDEVIYRVVNNFSDFNLTRNLIFYNNSNNSEINFTITSSKDDLWLSILKFPIDINASSVYLVHRNLTFIGGAEDVVYCTDSTTPETLTSSVLSFYDHDNIDSYCIHKKNNITKAIFYLYDYHHHVNVRRDLFGSDAEGDFYYKMVAKDSSLLLNNNENFTYFIKYRREDINKSKLPIYGRAVNMYDAVHSFTDHADNDNYYRGLAFYYGTSNTSSPNFNSTKGFIPLDLALTKSVYVNATSTYTLKNNASWKSLVDVLYAHGYDITTHGIFPNGGLSFSIFAQQEVFSYLSSYYPQTSRSYIPHSSHESHPSYQGWNSSSSNYIMQMFYDNNITNSWSYYNLLYYGGEQLDFGIDGSYFISTSNLPNNLLPTFNDMRISSLYEVPKIHKNRNNATKFFEWFAYDLSYTNTIYQYFYKNSSIDSLIATKGLLFPHVYLLTDYPQRILTYNDSEVWDINETFQDGLNHMSEEQKDGRLWTTGISDWVDYYAPLFETTYEPTSSGFNITNNGDWGTKGIQIVWQSNISSAKQKGNYLIYVKDNKFVISSLNPRESADIEIVEGGSYNSSLPQLIKVDSHVYVKKAEYNSSSKEVNLTIYGYGNNRNVSINYNQLSTFRVKDNNELFAEIRNSNLYSSTENYRVSYGNGILNFTIPTMSTHEIVIQEYTIPTSNIGGGGSVNGVSGSISGGLSTEMSYNLGILTPDKEVVININEGVMKVTSIKIEVNKIIKDAEMTVKTLSGNPAAEVSGRPYQYLEIKSSKLNKDNIQEMKISFKVEKTWVENNNFDKKKIFLNRYTDKWEKLPTKLISRTNDYYYYESRVSGLSYFVITGEVCEPDSKKCVKGSLEKCSKDGVQWFIEKCEFGCNIIKLECIKKQKEVYPVEPPKDTKSKIIFVIFGVIFLIALVIIIKKLSNYFKNS